MLGGQAFSETLAKLPERYRVRLEFLRISSDKTRNGTALQSCAHARKSPPRDLPTSHPAPAKERLSSRKTARKCCLYSRPPSPFVTLLEVLAHVIRIQENPTPVLCIPGNRRRSSRRKTFTFRASLTRFRCCPRHLSLWPKNEALLLRLSLPLEQSSMFRSFSVRCLALLWAVCVSAVSLSCFPTRHFLRSLARTTRRFDSAPGSNTS